MQHELQPIAALASGGGAAAVAVLRLSGENCHALIRPCLTRVAPTKQLGLTRIVDPSSGETLDEALVVHFRGPHSYTGEDSVEIQCHGGTYVVQRLLHLLYARGFRPAEPGEFTRRAFLHGKLDLTAAEGIQELIEAQSHQQWLAARHLTTGRLRTAIEVLRQTLTEALAYLEAQIDFPDEGDTAKLHLGQVRSRVAAVEAQIRHLLSTYDNGRVASRGLRVALCGAPNAGKSTLLNTLLGRERAIVTEIAGTTRDYLEEACLLDGRMLRLVDMAGLRHTTDRVEAMGVEAARRLAGEADLVLFLVPADASTDPQVQLATWETELRPRTSRRVLTKIDLGKPAWVKANAPATSWLQISCQTGAGMDQLRADLVAAVDSHVAGLGVEAAYVTSARHAAALHAAAAALGRYGAADADGSFEELLAFELGEAVRALRSIIGEISNEDVLDKVFSTFCLGK